jgi:hypothetical protein
MFIRIGNTNVVPTYEFCGNKSGYDPVDQGSDEAGTPRKRGDTVKHDLYWPLPFSSRI